MGTSAELVVLHNAAIKAVVDRSWHRLRGRYVGLARRFLCLASIMLPGLL